jgi:putative membrane protein
MQEYPNDENGLAQLRTQLSLQRSLLAIERTFAAWIRTGLASMGAGLGVAGLLGHLAPPALVLAISITLVIVGGAIYILGLWRYLQGSSACARNDNASPP